MTQYFEEKYPNRFYNIGIAEANMVGIAAGFAACGATAFVNTFAIFATGRVYDPVSYTHLASAIGWIMALFIFILSLVQFRTMGNDDYSIE